MQTTERCPRCTAVLPASAHFCRRCGAAMIEAPARAVVAPPPLAGRGTAAFNAQPRLNSAGLLASVQPRRPWLNMLGFLVIIAIGLMFVTRHTVSSHPQWAPGDSTEISPVPARSVPIIVDPLPVQAPVIVEHQENRDAQRGHWERSR